MLCVSMSLPYGLHLLFSDVWVTFSVLFITNVLNLNKPLKHPSFECFLQHFEMDFHMNYTLNSTVEPFLSSIKMMF